MIVKKLQQLNLKTPIAIIGAGLTGKSCFDLLNNANIKCTVLDESNNINKLF